MNVASLRRRLLGRGPRPCWGVVLGSGFDTWLDSFALERRVSFEEVDGLPAASVPGHGGYFAMGRVKGNPVALSVGRLHLYEGLQASTVVEPVRVLRALGTTSLLFTAAVGSVKENLPPGTGLVVTDQINLTGQDPHTASGRFPDASLLYDPGHVETLLRGGLKGAVLAGVAGPSLETPAEVRAMEALGADAVCMSTVLEVLFAAGHGSRCAAVAVVANRAGRPGTAHQDVLRTVRASAGALWEAVARLIAT